MSKCDTRGGYWTVEGQSLNHTTNASFTIDFGIIPEEFVVEFWKNGNLLQGLIYMKDGLYIAGGLNAGWSDDTYRNSEAYMKQNPSSKQYCPVSSRLNGTEITITPATQNSGYWTGDYKWKAR